LAGVGTKNGAFDLESERPSVITHPES
jgi:hypothetical protein